MLPGTPFPDRLSRGRHLRQVVRVHLADVVLLPSRILTRRKAVLLYPALDAPGDVVGNSAHTIEQHVSIAQQNAVVMVIRMAHFPQHLAVPVRFENHPAFEREATEKALPRRAPVIEERAPLGEIARQTWRVRQVPGVNHLTAEVDEIHPSVSPDEG